MVPFESLGAVSYSHSIAATDGRIFSRFDTIRERDRHPSSHSATAPQQVPRYAAAIARLHIAATVNVRAIPSYALVF